MNDHQKLTNIIILQMDHNEEESEVFDADVPLDQGEDVANFLEIEAEKSSEAESSVAPPVERKEEGRRSLKKILRSWSKKTILKCNVCNKVFTTKELLSAHMLKHEEENSYSCQYCDAEYSVRKSLLRHIERKHTKKQKDENIVKLPSQPAKIDQPLKKKVEKGLEGPSPLKKIEKPLEKTLPVPPVEKSIGRPPKKIAPIDQNYHPCPECAMVFHSKDLLGDHVHSHIEQQIYKCEKCSKYISGMIPYLDHMSQH